MIFVALQKLFPSGSICCTTKLSAVYTETLWQPLLFSAAILFVFEKTKERKRSRVSVVCLVAPFLFPSGSNFPIVLVVVLEISADICLVNFASEMLLCQIGTLVSNNFYPC